MVSSDIIPKSSFSSNGLSTEGGREGRVRERKKIQKQKEDKTIYNMCMFTYIENMLMDQFDSFYLGNTFDTHTRIPEHWQEQSLLQPQL